MRLFLAAPLAFLLPLCLGENITARAGITAGFHGIYMCSDVHWRGTCLWHEIQYADIESQNCIHLQSSDQGFGSMGPDKGLGVYIWGPPNCPGNPLPMFDPLTCPGTDVLGSEQMME